MFTSLLSLFLSFQLLPLLSKSAYNISLRFGSLSNFSAAVKNLACLLFYIIPPTHYCLPLLWL